MSMHTGSGCIVSLRNSHGMVTKDSGSENKDTVSIVSLRNSHGMRSDMKIMLGSNKLIQTILVILTVSTLLTGCSAQKSTSESKYDYKIAMVTSASGINDQSYNQLAWEGMQELSAKYGIETNYIELNQLSDVYMDLDILADNGAGLLWSLGSESNDALTQAAKANPDLNYVIVDYAYDVPPKNVTALQFRSAESSFLVGYIAAAVSKTGRVGFLGGLENEVIEQFEYGYRAGAIYGGKKYGKDIVIDTQYAETFSDAAKGRAITQRMKSDGCDVIFQAAGVTGQGMIEAAAEEGIWAIGVDRDQSYLAKDTVLTSALKNTDKGVMHLSEEYMSGKKIGGQNVIYGLKEGAVGIPEDHPNYSDEIYNEAMDIKDKIINGDIVPPGTKEEYADFLNNTQLS